MAISFHQENLPGLKERLSMKKHSANVLGRLKELV
jgi:hypothetical protein